MSRKQVQLIFGQRDCQLVHISDVPSGLACCCRCPACDDRLVARKGSQREHHFAHESGAECASAVETALHLAAKDALARRRELRLPAVTVRDQPTGERTLYGPEVISLDNVRLEQRVGSFVPDVVADYGDASLLIEIRVTHAVDDVKLERIRSKGISALEVDLSKSSRTLSVQQLEKLVIDQIEHKSWLFHVEAHALWQKFVKSWDLLNVRLWKFGPVAMGCPLGNPPLPLDLVSRSPLAEPLPLTTDYPQDTV